MSWYQPINNDTVRSINVFAWQNTIKVIRKWLLKSFWCSLFCVPFIVDKTWISQMYSQHARMYYDIDSNRPFSSINLSLSYSISIELFTYPDKLFDIQLYITLIMMKSNEMIFLHYWLFMNAIGDQQIPLTKGQWCSVFSLLSAE